MARKTEDPTRHAQELTLAAGAASQVLSSVVYRVAKKRLREREATTVEDSEKWAPSEEELALLRHRYIEHRALDEAGLSAWRPFREHWAGGLIGMLAKAVYRLVLFIAASIVIYQFILHGRT